MRICYLCLASKLIFRKSTGKMGSDAHPNARFRIDRFDDDYENSIAARLVLASYVKRGDEIFAYTVPAPARNYMMYEKTWSSRKMSLNQSSFQNQNTGHFEFLWVKVPCNFIIIIISEGITTRCWIGSRSRWTSRPTRANGKTCMSTH